MVEGRGGYHDSEYRI